MGAHTKVAGRTKHCDEDTAGKDIKGKQRTLTMNYARGGQAQKYKGP